MCTAATQSLLETIVEEKVAAGEMFTAFDVSIEAKGRGETDRHRNIKHVVHDYFEAKRFPADYTRTLINVGAADQAFVYHRTIDDPTAYVPKPRGGNRQQPVKAVVPPPSVNSLSVVAPPTQNDGGAALPTGITAKADARLTVLIPADVIRKAGFQPKANVAVYADPTEKAVIVVADRTLVPAGSTTQFYTVDAASNVRVASGLFGKAGLKIQAKGDRFTVEYKNQQVTIKSAS